MSEGRITKLRTDAIDEELHARLLNWGRWLRQNPSRLDFPHKVCFMQFPERGYTVDELDAMHIEEIVSTFEIAGLGLSRFHSAVLKIEYVERADSSMNPVDERAEDVARKFSMPFSVRSYYLI